MSRARTDDDSSSMGRWLWTWSNGLTALRLLTAVPLAWAIGFESWELACALFWFAVATDLADGRVARARGETSVFGGVFDHATDAFFVSTGLCALAATGVVAWALPLMVVAAFLQYVLDSKALSGRRLRASALGRWNGILYFIPVGVVVTRGAIGLAWPEDAWLNVLGWGLIGSTAISMADRLWALLSATAESTR